MRFPRLELDAFRDMPVAVATVRELRAAGHLATEAMGRKLLVLWRNGEPVAYEDRCPHMGLPLSMGRVEGETITCAYHGWSFAAGDGAVTAQPSLHEPRPCRLASLGCMRWGDIVFAWLDPDTPLARIKEQLPAAPPSGLSLFRVTFDCPFWLALYSSVDFAHFRYHTGFFQLHRIYRALAGADGTRVDSVVAPEVVSRAPGRVDIALADANRNVTLHPTAALLEDGAMNHFLTFVTPISPEKTVYWECYRPTGGNVLLRTAARGAFHTATRSFLTREDRRWLAATWRNMQHQTNINLTRQDTILGEHLRSFVLPALQATEAQPSADLP